MGLIVTNTAPGRRHYVVERLPESDSIGVNAELCVGCRTCELVCSLHHEKAFHLALSRLHVTRDPFSAFFQPEVCRQCLAPECYIVCPVEGAMYIDEQTGARVIATDKCIGCGACARACPWNQKEFIIRLNKEHGVYVKCDLCDGDPQCVAFCPVTALTYISTRRKQG